MALPVNDFYIGTIPTEKFILLLICEELKSRKFFDTLKLLGLDNSDYQPNLDDVILNCIGLCDDSNATLDFYYALIEKHASEIEASRESIETQALLVYQNLTEEKKRMDLSR